MRRLIEYRFVLSLAASAVGGVLGLHALPFPADNLIFGFLTSAPGTRRGPPPLRGDTPTRCGACW